MQQCFPKIRALFLPIYNSVFPAVLPEILKTIAVVFLQFPHYFSFIFPKFSQNIPNIFSKFIWIFKIIFSNIFSCTRKSLYRLLSKCSKIKKNFFETILEILRNKPRNFPNFFLKFLEKNSQNLPKHYLKLFFGRLYFSYFTSVFEKHTTKYKTLTIHFSHFMQISCFVNVMKK